jgi:glycosyltransferase involved in cell wall biosynthesis
MRNVLWLASWFPNKVEPFSGDFIQRHAQAASAFSNIFVLATVKANELVTPQRKIVEAIEYNPHCKAEIIYYNSGFIRIKWLDRFVSTLLYLNYFINSVKTHIKQEGKPHCIHVHVALKAGLIALYFKWTRRIPYIVSEHWSGIYPESREGLKDRGLLFRWLWKLVIKQASTCTAVSQYLANLIQKKFAVDQLMVIPNAVNETIFYPDGLHPDHFHFIHVSTLGYEKNPEQLLEAVSLLKKKTDLPFKLLVYGDPPNGLVNLARNLDLSDRVEFRGTVSQQTLASSMRKCQALILYSRYETFGCVIIEANACGIPVIASELEVLHEIITDGENGIFAQLGSPELLAEKMRWMMQNNLSFDKAQMYKMAVSRFGFAAVGRKFDALYESLELAHRAGVYPK